jgi:hypothetical protein
MYKAARDLYIKAESNIGFISAFTFVTQPTNDILRKNQKYVTPTQNWL